MNPDQEKSNTARAIPGEPAFVTDQNGRTLFYAIGLGFAGYVVPNAGREWALRDAVERFKWMDTTFGWVMAPLLAGSMWALGGPHTDQALAVITAIIAVAVIVKILQRRWCFGELVAGLDRVGPWDLARRRRVFFVVTLFSLVYCCFVGWRILQAIQSYPP